MELFVVVMVMIVVCVLILGMYFVINSFVVFIGIDVL